MSAILEGAAQVLEAGGLAGFTTNAVAERAGVSIGTLYQYFSDKGALLHALAEPRKAVVQAVLAQGMAIEMVAPVAAFIADAESSPQRGIARLTREQQFVLSRALMGAIRAAVIEEAPFFKSRAFEDELVRLVLSYVGSVSKPMTTKPSL